MKSLIDFINEGKNINNIKLIINALNNKIKNPMDDSDAIEYVSNCEDWVQHVLDGRYRKYMTGYNNYFILRNSDESSWFCHPDEEYGLKNGTYIVDDDAFEKLEEAFINPSDGNLNDRYVIDSDEDAYLKLFRITIQRKKYSIFLIYYTEGCKEFIICLN